MGSASRRKRSRRPAVEAGAIRKRWSGRIRVALIFPNSYRLGMANLGFQSVYRLLNDIDHVVCERLFLPSESGGGAKTGPIVSVESGRPPGEFDVLAFSLSFENDYPGILRVLAQAGLPLKSIDRGPPHPLVLAGGVACMLNPEPLAPFIDCFLLGEAESMLTAFFEGFDPAVERRSLLQNLARRVPGTYVPEFYRSRYADSGPLSSWEPVADVPDRIAVPRPGADTLAKLATCTSVVAADTAFEGAYLVEVGRGCPHGCRFCSAGYLYRPPRFRPLTLLKDCIRSGLKHTDHIGLVGAAVSDLPDLPELCRHFENDAMRLSFSSLRADSLTPELVAVLHRSGVRSATIAPEAGSERMRRVINKGLNEEQVLTAVEMLVQGGVPGLKLYFMLGLPTETFGDVEEIVRLCKRIKHVFLTASRPRGHMGQITVSLSSFVPKPTTPFQWTPMDDVGSLKSKITHVRQGLRRVANVRVHADTPRWAYVQGLLARGDRRVGRILKSAYERQGNWRQTFRESSLNPDFFVTRRRPLDEILPWDFIDHGLRREFLESEYRRALAGRPSPPCPMKDCQQCGICIHRPAGESPPRGGVPVDIPAKST